MDAPAVNAIRDLAQFAQEAAERVVRIGDVDYATTKLFDLRAADPEPVPLAISTLSGFVAYVQANLDAVELARCLAQVVAHDHVRLIGPLRGHFQQRAVYAEARTPNRLAAAAPFAFGRWMEPEDLVIALQILFLEGADRARVLQLLGTIRDENLRTSQDDGVTQTVTVRSGLALIADQAVPNPVRLVPFRTFDEIEQPESPFVLRLRKEGGIEAALFEADGGAWRSQAIRSIETYLIAAGVAPTIVA